MPVIPFLPLIATGIGLAGSALLGNKKTTTNQSSTQQQTFDPIAQAARQQAGSAIGKELSNPLSLDPGLLSQGLTGINRSFNLAIPQLQDVFSSRGLGTSGLFGGSLNNQALGRLGQIGQLYQQVLSTADARNRANIQQALQLGQPTGATSTGTSVTRGPGTAAGLGGGLTDVASFLSLISALKGGGIFGNNTSAPPDASLANQISGSIFSGVPSTPALDVNTAPLLGGVW